MALSNWDTLAIGTDGKSTSGTFQIGDFTIGIYKSWAYVENPKMWNKEIGYSKNVICEIHSGELNFGQFKIKSQRGNQNSIHILIECGYGDTKQIFAGIGCYGFDDHSREYLESKGYKYPEDGFIFSTWRRNEGEEEGREYLGWYENGKELLVEIDNGVELHPFTGVNEKTLEEFQKFLRKELDLDDEAISGANEKWFKSVEWNNLLRYNQGDAYFANAVNSETIPGTEVGKQDDPIIIKSLIN